MSKILRIFLIVMAAGCALTSLGQGRATVTARITTWYHDQQGAVSFSFDDAGFTQYTAAYPILGKNDLKGTFSIVGEWVKDQPALSAETGFFEYLKMGWPELLELQAKGHELAAHGMVHSRYDKFSPVDSLALQMRQIRSLIESRTGTPVLTMHYPYSYASGNIPPAAEKAGFLFCRSGLDTVNPVLPPDMHLLASQAILNESNPDSAIFSHWLNQAKGNWLILMYHNLFAIDSREMALFQSHEVEYTYSISPEAFEKQVKEVLNREYWIAAISSVGKYIMERENTTIQLSRSIRKAVIKTRMNLDKEIFDQPLTLEIEVPWQRTGVKGSLQDGIYNTGSMTLFIDILPGSVITLYREK